MKKAKRSVLPGLLYHTCTVTCVCGWLPVIKMRLADLSFSLLAARRAGGRTWDLMYARVGVCMCVWGRRMSCDACKSEVMRCAALSSRLSVKQTRARGMILQALVWPDQRRPTDQSCSPFMTCTIGQHKQQGGNATNRPTNHARTQTDQPQRCSPRM